MGLQSSTSKLFTLDKAAKAMNVLKKIESSHREILDKYIDQMHLNKYEKWKRFNAPKGKKKGKGKRKRISPIKRSRTAGANKLAKEQNIASIETSLSVPDVVNENGN